MAKIFILPKQDELQQLGITAATAHTGNPRIHLFFPQQVIVPTMPGSMICDVDQTAKKITREIAHMSADEEEVYLLYHIGYALSLDEELLEYMPHLHTSRYSHDNANYDQIRSLIKEVGENNCRHSAEAIIRDFFFDKKAEAGLMLIHACETPQGARNIASIPDLPLLKNISITLVIDGHETKLNIIDFIRERLVNNTDCLSDEYISNLHILNNALIPNRK